MTYQRDASLICLGDAKQAALYFERVIPISFVLEKQWISYLKRGVYSTPNNYLAVIANLIEPDHRVEFETIKSMLRKFDLLLVATINSICAHCQLGERYFSLEQFQEFLANLPAPEEMTKEDYKNLEKEIRYKPPCEINQLVYDEEIEESFVNFDFLFLMGLSYIENIKVPGTDIYFRSIIDEFTLPSERGKAAVLLPEKCLTNFEASENDLSLSLANIQIVDTNKIQWDQILEFRRDKESRKKLRNLKLFLHKSYEGKNRAFIEDDLNKRIEDYKNAANDWGFDLITSTLSAAMDSKSIQASLSASLVSSLYGEPILTTGAALPGILKVGKIAIEFLRKKHAFHRLKRDHDLAYIIEAKEHFGDTS